MNKIIVKDSNITITDKEVNLCFDTNKVTITIDGTVCINDLDNNKYLELNIVLLKDSKLLYNRFNKDISNFKINFEVIENSNLEFNYSLYQTIPSNILFNANVLGNNNNIKFNIRGVTNDNGSIYVDATSDCVKNIKNNDVLESIKIINLTDNNNVIIPNLLVSSNDIIVNHNATISNVDDSYLFYLESKCLDTDCAKKLIVNGFLKENIKISDWEVKLDE